MNSALILCLILLGSYSAASIGLSVLVVLLWHSALKRTLSRADDILGVRLVPTLGALLLSLAVVLPAFLEHEPTRESETTGLVIWGLASLGLLIGGTALRRGWRAREATRNLERNHQQRQWIEMDGHQITIVEIMEPVVAVLGTWHPRIIVARLVIAACSPLELHQVVAHELAHLSARDNLKFLFLLCSPDVLAWLPVQADFVSRWRMAAEFEADQRATGSNEHKRLALASAIIKVARMGIITRCEPDALTMPAASDNIEARVLQLLSPSLEPDRSNLRRWLIRSSLLFPLLAVPFYAAVQRWIETLVALGL